MRSSTKPVTLARSSCWRIKYFPLFPATTLDTRIITPIITTASTVRIGLSTSIEMNVTTIVKEDINTCGMDWLIICLNVSVSFV